MEEHGRLQSMGLQRVGHDWATSLSANKLIRLYFNTYREAFLYHSRHIVNSVCFVFLWCSLQNLSSTTRDWTQPRQWKHRVLTTGPQGNFQVVSLCACFNNKLKFFLNKLKNKQKHIALNNFLIQSINGLSPDFAALLLWGLVYTTLSHHI